MDTTVAPAQLSHSWPEQRPSNEGDLVSSVMVEGGRVDYTGEDLLLFTFLYCGTYLILGNELVNSQ
jgi:hypothetical protein